MLAIFISKELDENTTLAVPVEDSVLSRENNRPELRLFEAQSLLAEAQRKQIDSRLMPKVGAFGVGMLNTGLGDQMKKEVFAAGVSVSWNIGALYTRKNDLRQIDVRKQQIATNREAFLLNTRLQTVNEEGSLKDLREQISQDEEIIRLSENIKTATQKKVEGGTETVNELLRTINAVSEARQQQALHRIQLLQESYKFKHTLGN
jgi:outer membrane protein TolC